MPDPEYTFRPVDDGHDPFAFSFRPVDPDHDPFANQDEQLSASMTHPGLDPAAEDIGRRTRQVGQNLWNTWTAPFQAAKQLGTAATSGTLDVTDPATAGNAFDLVAALAGGPGRPGAGELYANPAPKIVGDMVAKIDDMIARGYSKYRIIKETGLGSGTVQRYLAKSGQKTAASEIPSFWTPETEEQLIAYRNQGVSHPEIARKMDLTLGQVESKIYALRDAGRMDFAPRWEPFLNDPKKTAEFIQDVNEGWSQNALNRKYGWASSSAASRRISALQERGELQGYAPQGGTGLTPAGRNPTLPQTRFMQGEVPDDPEMTKALINYLRSLGLHASLGQPIFG